MTDKIDTSTEAAKLHDTTDAATWAKEFCKLWPSALCQITGKEGVSNGDDFEATMIGWFANAIMAGVDSEARALAAERDRLAAQLAEARAEGWRKGIEAAAQPLTDAEAYSAALSYRHDLGLLPQSDQQSIVRTAKWWHDALSHRIRALPLPADLREVVDMISGK